MANQDTKAAKDNDKHDKMISTEQVACLLASAGIVAGAKTYAVMATVDKSKTANGWNHFFRPINARAKEIKAMIDSGKLGDLGASPAKTDAGTPGKKTMTPKKATAATAAAAGGSGAKSGGTKRARKGKKDDEAEDDEGESPSKKVKSEPDDEPTMMTDEDGVEFPF